MQFVVRLCLLRMSEDIPMSFHQLDCLNMRLSMTALTDMPKFMGKDVCFLEKELQATTEF